MSYNVEKLPDLPVVLATLYADYNNAHEGEAAMDDTVAMLDEQSEPVYYVFDVSRYSPSLDDIIAATNWRGERGRMPAVQNPNVIETIIVSQRDIVKLVVKGVNTVYWDFTSAQVFDTLEEALDYVRLEISL